MMLFRRSEFCFGFLLVCLFASAFAAGGAERRASGREVYRRLCAECHGRDGQGVKGKYDDALYGDWSLEKLTRYIEKNMPEDAPEKCTGPDAEAVARYIYDAFYSREARVRKKPPRIELVRLTNRQYLNSVADLINEFNGSNATERPSERGLKATYYDARGFNRGKVIHERIDPQVHFDFGQSSPDSERIGTNEFSMQWRGAVVAEESGDYEFILKTPNGARLWVNNDEQTLIDGWVASGDLSEHKATIRLIGGRAYPLKLDFFKFKDKTASISLQWKPPHGVVEPIPARNLLPQRVPETLVVSTPFPPDDSSVGYERGVAISKAWDEATTRASVEAANYIVKHLDRLAGTKPGDTNRIASIEAFCSQFVELAFRRPLTEEQKRIFVTAHFKNAPKGEDAVKRTVLMTLKSPRFLYLGLNSAKSDDFIVAERLSFALWDSLPDQELRMLARNGELRNHAQVTAQARRMLRDPRARSKVQHFLHHWLQMDHVEDLSKDSQLFPGFTPEMTWDLRKSLNLFLEDVVWSDASDYRQLLQADYLFLNERLARFYEVPAVFTNEFVKVTFDPAQRSGVITHPYLLAAFSYQKSTSPIHRGVFLTRNIVGRALKPPPMAVAFKDSDFAPDLTMREKITELTRPQACQSCHSVINPLGFSLEHYDAVGRFRTEENRRPIDAVSDYATDDGKIVRLTGARDVARFAVQSEHAQNAFIEQLFNQIVKQPMLAYGRDVMDRLRQSFVASEFNIQKLIVDIVSLAALHNIDKRKSS